MNNGERGRRLIAMATEYLQDMEASYGRKSCNAVVRRAQEVVEPALKGVLSYLGVDFPKVRDPAAVFLATLSARGMALGAAEAADVTAVSARLARKRAPAFYFEHTEDASAAEGKRRLMRAASIDSAHASSRASKRRPQSPIHRRSGDVNARAHCLFQHDEQGRITFGNEPGGLALRERASRGRSMRRSSQAWAGTVRSRLPPDLTGTRRGLRFMAW